MFIKCWIQWQTDFVLLVWVNIPVFNTVKKGNWESSGNQPYDRAAGRWNRANHTTETKDGKLNHFLFPLHTREERKPRHKHSVYRPGNHWKLNWCFWKLTDHWDCTSQRKHKRPEIRERREGGSRGTGGKYSWVSEHKQLLRKKKGDAGEKAPSI